MTAGYRIPRMVAGVESVSNFHGVEMSNASLRLESMVFVIYMYGFSSIGLGFL